eukprot:GHRR01032095.1.p4 GENE.GHRR01032095.1~~GHRR01032095.1.p4  ORF type:complete len:106 (+),score=48.58 GHRR01032095.1:1163-1480(+)
MLATLALAAAAAAAPSAAAPAVLPICNETHGLENVVVICAFICTDDYTQGPLPARSSSVPAAASGADDAQQYGQEFSQVRGWDESAVSDAWHLHAAATLRWEPFL